MHTRMKFRIGVLSNNSITTVIHQAGAPMRSEQRKSHQHLENMFAPKSKRRQFCKCCITMNVYDVSPMSASNISNVLCGHSRPRTGTTGPISLLPLSLKFFGEANYMTPRTDESSHVPATQLLTRANEWNYGKYATTSTTSARAPTSRQQRRRATQTHLKQYTKDQSCDEKMWFGRALASTHTHSTHTHRHTQPSKQPTTH